MDEACKQAPVGNLLPMSLYVHRDAIDPLESLLRVYDGCCGRTWAASRGPCDQVAPAFGEGFVSGLCRFDTDPPGLAQECQALAPDPRTRLLRLCQKHQSPVLHRKEAFLPADHPLHAKFARLTQQEEKHGLLDGPATIGTREGWERRLAERGSRFADTG